MAYSCTINPGNSYLSPSKTPDETIIKGNSPVMWWNGEHGNITGIICFIQRASQTNSTNYEFSLDDYMLDADWDEANATIVSKKAGKMLGIDQWGKDVANAPEVACLGVTNDGVNVLCTNNCEIEWLHDSNSAFTSLCKKECDSVRKDIRALRVYRVRNTCARGFKIRFGGTGESQIVYTASYVG